MSWWRRLGADTGPLEERIRALIHMAQVHERENAVVGITLDGLRAALDPVRHTFDAVTNKHVVRLTTLPDPRKGKQA